MIRKATAFVLTAIALGGTWAAGTGWAKVTTVSFALVCGNDERPGWQGIVDAFNKQSTDIKVKLEILPGGWTEYVQAMLLRAVAGTSPDIGRMGVAYMPQFANKRLLVDLMPYAVQDKYDFNLYYKGPFAIFTRGKQMLGVPAGIYTMANLYNRSLFDAAGLNPPVPSWENGWTWDEYRLACQKLTKKGPDGKVSQVGYTVNMHPERSLQWIWQNGADFFNEARTKCTVDSPEAVGALTYLQELMWKDQTASGADFLSGRAAMMQEGQWMMPSLNKTKKFKWGVAPMPRGKAGTFTELYVDPYVVFAGSKNKAAAWKVIRFFTGKDAENVLADKELMGVPVLKSVATARRESLFEPLSAAEKAVWFDSVNHAREVPFTTNWLDMMNAYTARISKVVTNKASVEDTARGIASDINKLLLRSK